MKSNASLLNRVFLSTAFLILAAALLLGFSVRNFISAQMHRVELVIEQQLLNTNMTQLAYLQKLASNEEQTREVLKEYALLLPANANQNEIFTSIQSLSDRYGVSVAQISFDKVKPEETKEVQKLPVSVTVKGEYGDVMAMLEEFTQEGRLAVVDSMTLQVEQASKGTISALVSADIYLQ